MCCPNICYNANIWFSNFDNFFISPGEFIPSSSTQIFVSLGIFASVSGIPISLLKLPIVLYVLIDPFKILNIHSFKVVFPLLPVTHIVVKSFILFLENFASLCNESIVLLT